MQAELCRKLDALGVDYRAGVERLGGNELLYVELLNLFLEDEDFDLLRAAILRADASEAFFRVHSLKGMAMNISLGEAARPLEKLTKRLYAGNLTGAMDLFDEFDRCCASVLEALEEANL